MSQKQLESECLDRRAATVIKCAILVSTEVGVHCLLWIRNGRSSWSGKASFIVYVYGVFLVGSTSTHSVLVKSAIYSIFIL